MVAARKKPLMPRVTSTSLPVSCVMSNKLRFQAALARFTTREAEPSVRHLPEKEDREPAAAARRRAAAALPSWSALASGRASQPSRNSCLPVPAIRRQARGRWRSHQAQHWPRLSPHCSLPKQILLGSQHGRKICSPLFVLFRPNSQGAARSVRAPAQVSDLDPRLQEGGNAIIDLLLGFEDGVLIIDQQLLQLRVLQPHVVGDLSVIQDTVGTIRTWPDWLTRSVHGTKPKSRLNGPRSVDGQPL